MVRKTINVCVIAHVVCTSAQLTTTHKSLFLPPGLGLSRLKLKPKPNRNWANLKLMTIGYSQESNPGKKKKQQPFLKSDNRVHAFDSKFYRLTVFRYCLFC